MTQKIVLVLDFTDNGFTWIGLEVGLRIGRYVGLGVGRGVGTLFSNSRWREYSSSRFESIPVLVETIIPVSVCISLLGDTFHAFRDTPNPIAMATASRNVPNGVYQTILRIAMRVSTVVELQFGSAVHLFVSSICWCIEYPAFSDVILEKVEYMYIKNWCNPGKDTLRHNFMTHKPKNWIGSVEPDTRPDCWHRARQRVQITPPPFCTRPDYGQQQREEAGVTASW